MPQNTINSEIIENKNYLNIDENHQRALNELEEKTTEVYRQIAKPTYNPDKFLYTKKEILTYIINRSSEKKEIDPSSGNTMNKIISRAQKGIDQLENGENVRIPTYYHATKRIEVAASILNDSILSSEANNGKGVYLSSEMEPDFGGFIFALDRGDVESKQIADSLVNRKETWSGGYKGQTTWRALKNDFPILEEKTINVAYVAVRDEKDIERLEEIKKTTGDFEIVSYEEAEAEREMIREIEGYYESISWNPSVNYGSEQLASIIAAKTSSPAIQQLDEGFSDEDWE